MTVMNGMQHGVVEGEPGIFPDPVARLMRGLGRIFDRRRRHDDDRDRPPAPPTAETGPEGETDAESAPEPPK
jgi:hypothetical protein